MHDCIPRCSTVGLSHPVPADAVRNNYERESQFEKGPDKSFEADIMCDHTPSHSATGSGLPISITAAQIEYEQNKDGGKLQSDKKSQSRKGLDKTLEVNIALNCVPLQSTAGPSQLITVRVQPCALNSALF